LQDAPVMRSDNDDHTETASSIDESPDAQTVDEGGRFISPDDPARLPIVEPEHYRRGPELARGGMGRVIAAIDRRYGRKVAIKELLHRSPRSEARFEREARITARLQHPSIVPMYEAGRWPDGEQFMAMKHVAGRPLKKLIVECSSLDERIALLPNVIAAVEAIAYVHSRGCVHRDLKPSNVLVGDFGETVVIDWGLARELDSTDEDVADVGPYRTAHAELTSAGAVVGTPMYMAPEQAAGEPVDQRADVYSLGALLYHTLTGGAPYADLRSKSTREVVEAVLSRPPAAASSVEPSLPADLDAVVSKAMAREPTDRYPSAAEMAADLRRFQTGQLVGAHQYSTWQLLRRWVGRHRALVAVTTSAAIVLAVVGGLAVNQVVEARDAAQNSRDASEIDRAAAEESRNEAEELVDFLVTDMRDALSETGNIDLLAKAAGRARAYNERHRTDVDDHDEMQRRAKAHWALADVFRLKGARAEAEAEIGAGLALVERHVERQGSSVEALHMTASFEVQLGLLAESAGDRATAEKHLKEGLALRRKVAEMGGVSKPTNLLENVNNSINRLGSLYFVAQEYDKAAPLYEEGLGVCKRLIELDPDEPAYKRNLSIAHINLGAIAHEQKRYDEARDWYAKALVVRRGLVARYPDVGKYNRGVGIVLGHIGDNERSAGDYPAALRALLEARELHVSLVNATPEDTDRREYLVIAEDTLAKLQLRMGEYAAALATARSAVAHMEILTATDESNVVWQIRKAIAHISAGDALELLGRAREGRVHLETALRLFESQSSHPVGAAGRDELTERLEGGKSGQ
jgi:serine/threonine protein kinase/tetratricopeptide (TPR) repeat protein